MRSMQALHVEVPAPHAQVLADAVGSGSMHGNLTVPGRRDARCACCCERDHSTAAVDQRCAMGRRGFVFRSSRSRSGVCPTSRLSQSLPSAQARDRSPSTTPDSERTSSSKGSTSTMRSRCSGARHDSTSRPAMCRGRRRKPPGPQRDCPSPRSGPASRAYGPAGRATGRQPADPLVRRPRQCPRRGRQAGDGRRGSCDRHHRRRHPRRSQSLRRWERGAGRR